jgi:outer membrane lipoprotein SlyB
MAVPAGMQNPNLASSPRHCRNAASMKVLKDDTAGANLYHPARISPALRIRLVPMKHLLAALLLLPLIGCTDHYSPDTYNAGAVQQAAKVQRGVIVGVRAVGVSANAATGTVTGAAAGGIAGSQVGAGGAASAFGALGGTVIGGLIGSTVEHSAADAPATEYVVRTEKGDLVSVTQQDKVPLAINQKVLVIDGKQARIVADYTAQEQPIAPPSAPAPAAAAPPAVTSQDLLRGMPAASPDAATPIAPPAPGAPKSAP